MKARKFAPAKISRYTVYGNIHSCNEYNYKGADSAFICARCLLVIQRFCAGSTLIHLGQGTAQHEHPYVRRYVRLRV